MKLQFDPNQQFQLDAVNAVADLFEGQPEMAPQYAPIHLGAYGGLFEGQESSELGVGNRLLLNENALRDNTRTIQDRNDIEVPERLSRSGVVDAVRPTCKRSANRPSLLG